MGQVLFKGDDNKPTVSLGFKMQETLQNTSEGEGTKSQLSLRRLDLMTH